TKLVANAILLFRRKILKDAAALQLAFALLRSHITHLVDKRPGCAGANLLARSETSAAVGRRVVRAIVLETVWAARSDIARRRAVRVAGIVLVRLILRARGRTIRVWMRRRGTSGTCGRCMRLRLLMLRRTVGVRILRGQTHSK